MANLNERICIVGGGPAGTSVAMYLEKKGYNNYVIYEKSNKIGGKAFSPLMKVKTKDGQWVEKTIEMGAVMGCDTYFAVAECEKFGHTSHLDGPKMGRRFMNTDGTPLKMSKLSQLKKLIKLNKLSRLLKKKYKGYDVNGHRGVAQGRYEGLCPSPELKLAHIEGVNENLKEKPLHVEGEQQSQWVVMDYGNVVVHIFQKEQRDYYQLEDFWADAEITNVEEN